MNKSKIELLNTELLSSDKLTEKKLKQKQIKQMGKLKIFGVKVARFYNGKWHDYKRGYRFKNKRYNPVAILRDILKRSGLYELKNFDKENSDKILGDLYLFCDERVDGFIIQNPKLIKKDIK